MMTKSLFNKRGITLIELLVAFVICAFVVAGIYRVFVAQTRAYTVQEQVVEVQQNIRTAMEFLLRDLRMAGYDSDSLTSKINIATAVTPGDHEVTVNYEYDDTHRYEVKYYLNNRELKRDLTIWPDAGVTTVTRDTILENVNALDFTYGVDTNDDGVVENWVSAGGIGVGKVVAVQVVLTANPDQTNPDVRKVVSPKTLASRVTLRNQCLR